MFNVLLCSDWSKSSYPENNGGKFTNLLHHNLNFSREDWSIAISDIVYTPDTWASVREKYNDVVIHMKGFQKWGIGLFTLRGVKKIACIRSSRVKVYRDDCAGYGDDGVRKWN